MLPAVDGTGQRPRARHQDGSDDRRRQGLGFAAHGLIDPVYHIPRGGMSTLPVGSHASNFTKESRSQHKCMSAE